MVRTVSVSFGGGSGGENEDDAGVKGVDSLVLELLLSDFVGEEEDDLAAAASLGFAYVARGADT